MIVVYEPFSTGLNHIPVNSEFITIVSKRFSSEEIIFHGEKNHIHKVAEHIKGVQNVKFEEMTIVEPAQGKIKTLINEEHNIKALSKKYKGMIKLLVILNSHPHTMFLVKKFFNEKIPVIFIIHGNIEELTRKKRLYQMGFWIKPAFYYKHARKNTKYVVLGTSIKENLLKYVECIGDNLVAVPHPYSFKKVICRENRKEKTIVNMGIIGSLSPEKRSELIFELERRLKERKVNNIHLLIVGAGDICELPDDTTVTFVGNGIDKLSDEDYNTGIQSLDYILFFWPRYSYKLTASGALCDAILHEKPIISIENDYLKWVFEEVGDLGFLCNSINEMEEIVYRISRGELKETTDGFSKNFEKARIFFSQENVGKILEEKNVWMT